MIVLRITGYVIGGIMLYEFGPMVYAAVTNRIEHRRTRCD